MMATRVCDFLPPKGPSAMYEIGAGPPVKAEWRHIQSRYPKMDLFGCEPHPPTFKKVFSHFGGELHPVAIHSTLRTTSVRSFSGLEKFGSHTILPGAGNRLEVIDNIPCWTLDEFDDRAGNPASILLWIDNEGSELDTLKSGPKLLNSGRVICINLEVRDESNVPGWPTARELAVYLKTIGYRHVHDYNNQKTHRDAIYVPQGSAYQRRGRS